MSKFRLLKILLLVVFILCPANFGNESETFAQDKSVAPAEKNATSEAQQKRRESFEIVWQTVKDFHFDPTFGGLDWDAVKKEFAPRAASAQSDRELHQLLQEMLNRLGKSHFNIIPPENIPVIPPPEKDSSAADETSKEDDATPLSANGLNVTERLSHGIGIDFRIINNAAVITRVEPVSSAARAGLRPGFVLRSVNGESMTRIIAMMARQAVFQPGLAHQFPEAILYEYFNGPPETFVSLAYLDALNVLHRVRLKREKLKGEMSPQFMTLPPQFVEFEAKRLQRNIGYIRFNVFAAPVLEKFCAAVKSMRDAPGIIIDLRGNRGGILGLMYGMGGLLESRNVSFGEMKMRGGTLDLRVMPQKNPYRGDVVILIDSTSQSASEMFAGGIKESDRGLVVGEKSAGSALPSTIKELPTGAILQYAFADIVTPSGHFIEGQGIEPDIAVKLDRRSLLRGRDTQLESAINAIQPSVVVNASAPPPPPAIVIATNEPREDKRQVEKESVKASETVMTATVDPQVEQILERYVQAIGGREAIEKITSVVLKGTFEGSFKGISTSGAAEIIGKAPDKSVTLLTVPGMGVIRRGYTGAYAYEQIPLFGFRKIEGLELDIIKESSDIHWDIHLKQHYSKLILKGKEKIGDTEADVVEGTLASGIVNKLYFDVKTGLLIRKDDVYYEDYKQVDGIMFPHTFRGADTTIKLTEVKHNVAVEDTKFIEEKNCFTQ